ncbi:hypothetical protein E1B28_007352 [Marasmius oreades]|uniref:Ubiquinone biosynthesis O-methyltransferase, mitochondrial n=1 Tax=Marasmius oreades TaxID=181124 RepID=A0A9P7S249_9AGAR|nr:uncharacterized protein E1B28_007352 [Marasmius oreades]KAG7093697.1 hypothetical protein E1B28_007352 [Marasmius oreades]
MTMVPSRVLLGSSTVNASEIAHFSRLSAQWWDERGEFSFLHSMNPIRMQFIRQKFAETTLDESETKIDSTKTGVLMGLDVLDVGCGGGLLSESLARLGARVLGIDASESNIAIAKHHASLDSTLNSNLSYKHTSAEVLLNRPKRFDVVCSMEVLEHVDNPTAFLSTCAELIKPSGHLFLSTISRTPLAYLLTIFLAEKALRKVTEGTHTYSKYIKPSELIEYFREYRSLDNSRPWISRISGDLPTRTEAEVRGLVYNPLQSNWILAPRGAWGATDCNYLFWVRKPGPVQ